MAEQFDILGGKVHVYKRPNSSHWQCSSYFAGKNRRTSTKEDSLSKAKEIAEDWYLQLRGKLRNGEIKTEKTFREASDLYLREYDIITQGQRSRIYVEGQHSRVQRSSCAVLRPSGPFRNHRRQGSGLPHSPPRGSDEEARQAAGPQHHASGNRHPPPDPENRPPPRLARSPSRSLRAVQIIPENLAPGVVLAGGIQKALRGNKKTRARAQKQPLQMGIGTASRLCPVLGQHRPAAGRGAPPAISRRDHRRRRGEPTNHP